MIGVDQEILNLEPLILGEPCLNQPPMLLRQRFFAAGGHLDPRLALFESLLRHQTVVWMDIWTGRCGTVQGLLRRACPPSS